MKSLAPLLALLLVPLAVPLAATPAAAQATANDCTQPIPTSFGTDDVGDVQAQAQPGTGTTAPAGVYDAADLRSMSVNETPSALIFTVGVTSLSPQVDPAFVGSVSYYTSFLQNDRVFRLRIDRLVNFPVSYRAQLQAFDSGRNGYSNIGSAIPVTTSDATNTMTVSVDRDHILDSHGNAPHPEIPIVNFNVRSEGTVVPINFARGAAVALPRPSVFDTMPTQGNLTQPLTIHCGVVQTGHARLSSDDPTRSSNGEATTFVFQVRGHNLDLKEDTFSLSTKNVLPTWDVKLPASQVTIPANGTIVFPVLVTTPFAHVHGRFDPFVVEMTSLSDSATVGRIQLGIRYANPPQPTGHHPMVWFHSQPGADDTVTPALAQAFGVNINTIFMNADDKDPTDESAPVPGSYDTEGLDSANMPRVTYQWTIPLSPGLELGLDFDLKDTMAEHRFVSVPITNVVPMQQSVLSGYLAYYEPPNGTRSGPGGNNLGPETVLADIVPTTPVDVGVQTETPFKADVAARPASDFIGYRLHASMVLYLNLTFTRADIPNFGPRDAPVIAPGGKMQLPLLEYHDPVNQVFVSNVDLLADNQQRLQNAGKTSIFNLTLQNRGTTDANFLVELTGTNVAWATLLAPSAIMSVPAGGKVAFHVAVAVPADAVAGTSQEPNQCNIIVSATNQADFNERALVRLVTTVDGTGTHVDEASAASQLSSAVSGGKKSPTVELPLAMLAIAALALALGRRRGEGSL
jgi:hypothetical protein